MHRKQGNLKSPYKPNMAQRQASLYERSKRDIKLTERIEEAATRKHKKYYTLPEKSPLRKRKQLRNWRRLLGKCGVWRSVFSNDIFYIIEPSQFGKYFLIEDVLDEFDNRDRICHVVDARGTARHISARQFVYLAEPYDGTSKIVVLPETETAKIHNQGLSALHDWLESL